MFLFLTYFLENTCLEVMINFRLTCLDRSDSKSEEIYLDLELEVVEQRFIFSNVL